MARDNRDPADISRMDIQELEPRSANAGDGETAQTDVPIADEATETAAE